MVRNVLSFISCICCLYAAGSMLEMSKELKALKEQQIVQTR
jgi:hypothetical protein